MCKGTGLCRIPLVKNVSDENLEPVIVNKLHTEHLRNEPLPSGSVRNVYKLKIHK